MKTRLNPQQALDATKRTQYVDKDVLDTWPETMGDLEYFKLDKYITAKELEEEYEKRGLLPAPFMMCAADGKDIVFDAKDCVATQWKDAKGNFCCLTFCRWFGERRVDCDRSYFVWRGPWWFAGVRKSALGTQDSALLDSQPLEAAIQQVKDAGYVIYKPV